MADRVVTAILRAKIEGYISPLKAAIQTTKDLTSELDKAAKAGKLDAVASSATKAGLLLIGGFAAINTAAARFEKQMSAVGAVSDATGEQMEELSKAALQAGKATKFSATEAAKAEEELAKAGISTADILGGALSGALDLAAAGDLDLAEAAETAAKAMNVFNLKGKDVGHVADVLAAAANKSATDVHELAFALKMGGLAARQSGIGLEETVGVFAAFADNALSGSDAGTSFKQMLLQLASPTDVAKNRMKELGINAFDAQGNFVGLTRLAGILQERLGGLTQQQRLEALATIFGADAMRAASVLFTEGEAGIREYTAAVNDQGAAQETARKKTDNLMGDIERLTGSLETLAIQSGSGTNQGLRVLTQTAGGLVDTLAALPAPVQTSVVLLAGLSGAGLLAFAAFIKVKSKAGEVVKALSDMGPAGEKAGRALQFTTRWAGRAALAFGAVQVGAAILNNFIGEQLDPQLEAATGGLKDWATQGKLAGEAARLFGDDAEDLTAAMHTLTENGFFKAGDAVDDFLLGIGGIASPLDNARARVQAFDQALVQLVQKGDAAQAAAAIQEMAKRSNLSIDQVVSVLHGYTGALEVASKGTGKAAGGMADDVTAAADVIDDETKKISAAWQETFEEFVTLEGAYETALDKMTGKQKVTTKDYIRELRKQVEAQEQWKTNMLLLAKRVPEGMLEELRQIGPKGAAQVKLLATMSDKELAVVVELWRRGGAASGVAFASSIDAQRPRIKTAVDAVDATMAHLERPRTASIHVQVTGIGAALDAWSRLRAIESRSVTIGINTFTGHRWGGITEHAQTGRLREAAMFNPPTRYAFAEPETGGEAFIPKRGNYGRSMAILSQAAAWHGAAVVPRGGEGNATVRVVFDVRGGDDEMKRMIRKWVRVDGGGDVQVAFT